MPRSRGFSFRSYLSGGTKTPPHSASPPADHPKNNSTSSTSSDAIGAKGFSSPSPADIKKHRRISSRPLTPPPDGNYHGHGSPLNASPTRDSTNYHRRSGSRPLSMVQTYQPRIMDVNEDTIPELLPVFSYLNSHSNKLYHGGYFLKLDDQNTQGKANPDRTWTECYAHLIGTVLSLWDAAELDAAELSAPGEGGEVLPKFLNLTDAQLKMIESLQMRADEQPLQNTLSISTAGNNRYLLHFNSHHDLVQWTAAIRLAIYEQNTLQEAYTGALIAGKGKTLNNINVILDRTREDRGFWVRVRFGAGQQWRRCWCVISPPDEKEFLKQQKEMKKRSPYDRSAAPTLKGKILFYDEKKEGKKQKKVAPLATINDAYSAYAIYPQAKALIDASTLLKIEGIMTLHFSTEPERTYEGFVFVMPEVNPMVSGFEMLLRFLFPTWDTFGLYGRPGKLVASLLDSRSLMFAMPKNKRYGYLEPLDVINLINENGSSTWSEQEWRRRLKEATGTRMNDIEDGTRKPHSRSNSRSSSNGYFGQVEPARPRVGFAGDNMGGPPVSNGFNAAMNGGRTRNISDPHVANGVPPNVYEAPSTPGPNGGTIRNMNTPEPVARPPDFGPSKHPGRPTSKAYHSPELRRANSRLSTGTLAQLAKAGGLDSNNQPMPTLETTPERRAMPDGAMPGPSVHSPANPMGAYANDNRSPQALSTPGQDRQPSNAPPPLSIPQPGGLEPGQRSPYAPASPYGLDPNAPPRPSTSSEGRRSPYPPGDPMGPPTGGPSRSPRPPPHGNAGPGPGGPMGGRGRPPPGGAPPAEFYGRGRGGPPGGPGGRGYGPPGPNQRMALPERSASFEKHISTTADDIIDSYASDGARQRDGQWRPPAGRGPPGPMAGRGAMPDRRPVPQNNYADGYGGPHGYPAGPPAGPYGAPGAPGPMGPPGGAPPYAQPPRPYSPSGPRPGTSGRNSPGPQAMGRGMAYPEDPQMRGAPWQARTASPGPGGPQAPPHGGAGRPPMNPGPQGSPSSFSRPLQPPAQQYDARQMPPQGQYSASGAPPPPGQRNAYPPYQGQAF